MSGLSAKHFEPFILDVLRVSLKSKSKRDEDQTRKGFLRMDYNDRKRARQINQESMASWLGHSQTDHRLFPTPIYRQLTGNTPVYVPYAIE